MKKNEDVVKQADEILNHIYDVTNQIQYLILQECPAYIFITAQALSLWFYRWFYHGLMGVLTVFKDGLRDVLSVFEYCRLAVPGVL